MSVKKLAETDTTITIGWDAVPGQEGFVGTLDGGELLVDGKRHFSGSETATQLKFGKPKDGKEHSYGVKILGSIMEGSVSSGTAVVPTINSWEYTRTWTPDVWKPAAGWNHITASSYSEAMAKFPALKPGDWLRCAFDFDGYLLFHDKDLTGGYIERIMGSDGKPTRDPRIKAVVELVGNYRNSVKSLYKNIGWSKIGGIAFVMTDADVQSPQTEGGADVNDCWDFALFDFAAHHTGAGGLMIQNEKQTMSRLLIQNEGWDMGYRVQEIDPHLDKGSGIHVLNVGDNPDSAWNLPVYDSRFASYSHDQKLIEGGNELTNLINCELWLKTENLQWKSGQDGVNYQDGGWTAVVWGYSKSVGPSRFQDNIFRYMEGKNQWGRVMEASYMGGTTAQCFNNVVEYARATNTNQGGNSRPLNSELEPMNPYDPNFVKLAGGKYLDCK